ASTSRQAMILLARGSEGTKVLQDLQAGGRGFFRMKLHAKNILALYSSRKCAAVLRARQRAINYRRTIGMRVINKGSIWHTAQKARTLADLNPVPADVRRFHRSREARTFSTKDRRAACLG